MRKYTSYENVGVLVGPTSGEAVWANYANPSWVYTSQTFNELIRVQSASFSFSNTREQIGNISDTHLAGNTVVSQPEVSLEIDYLVTDSCNERLVGLYLGQDKVCLDSMINNPSSIGNAFLLSIYDSENREMNFAKDVGDSDVIGIGNAYLTKYDFAANVSSFPSAKVTYSCSNVNFTTNESLKAEELSETKTYLDTFFDYNGSPAPQTLIRDQYDGGQVGWATAAEAFADSSPSVSSHSSSSVSVKAGWSTFFAGAANSFSEFNQKPYFILRQGASTDRVIKLEDNNEDKYITEIWENSSSPVSPRIIPNGTYRTGYYPSIDLIKGVSRRGYQYHITNDNFSGDIGSVSAIRPGDIELVLEQTQVGQRIKDEGTMVAVQKFALSVPLNRRKLLGLGSNYNYNQKLVLPSLCQVNVSLHQSEFIDSNLDDIFKTDKKYDFVVNLKKTNEVRSMSFDLSNAVLDSQSYSYGIGGVASVDLKFTCEMSNTAGVKIF